MIYYTRSTKNRCQFAITLVNTLLPIVNIPLLLPNSQHNLTQSIISIINILVGVPITRVYSITFRFVLLNDIVIAGWLFVSWTSGHTIVRWRLLPRLRSIGLGFDHPGRPRTFKLSGPPPWLAVLDLLPMVTCIARPVCKRRRRNACL